MENTKLLQKLADFQKELITIKKDAKNPFFKSKYATLETILVAITPTLNKTGLVITHSLSDRNVQTSIYDKDSGQSITSYFPVFGEKPQEVGSSITYARRYNIGALLNLNIDNDDDGNSANKAKPTYSKPAQPTQDETPPPAEEFESAPQVATNIKALKETKSFEKGKSVGIGSDGKEYFRTINPEHGSCNDCLADKVLNPKTGKIFCSAKCWV